MKIATLFPLSSMKALYPPRPPERRKLGERRKRMDERRTALRGRSAGADQLADLGQLLPQWAEHVQTQGVPAVGQCALGSLVYFHEDGIGSSGASRAGEGLNELRLAAGRAPRGAGKLDAVRGVEHHRPA